MKKYFLLLTVLLLLVMPSMAFAQSLDFSATPNFGSTSLTAGFLPDPHIVTIISGGSLDVSTMNLGAGCRGFATSAPDYRIQLSGTSSNLRFFFASSGDATLVVNSSNGQWFCNDDADGLNPIVDIPNAQQGQYDIWVGSFNASDRIRGYLMVTEFSASRPSSVVSTLFQTSGVSPAIVPTVPPVVVPTIAPPVSTSGLTIFGTPNFGTINLNAGFTPDPFRVNNVVSGGSIDAGAQNLGAGCRGFVTSNPDYRLMWAGTSADLRIYFVGNGDTTLLVNAANGQWFCNDDSAGSLNPSVDIINPPAGQYDIWVGSFTSGTNATGTLYVTELLETFSPSNPG